MSMIHRFSSESPLASLTPVASSADILEIQKLAEEVYVDERIVGYMVDLIQHTRDNKIAALGASPRASLSLYKATQAWALYNERDFATPDDVIEMSRYVLEHRIIIGQEGKLKHNSQKDIISQALEGTKVPVI